ncbi:hypothetical protein ACFU6I_05305 [Streptomyces sp. NPDC057486]|uniref:hypothetical protein n=1 Tax=Streptomyces sp. NPDC057486 TaxID=3346145 RepID=UPI0036C14AEF
MLGLQAGADDCLVEPYGYRDLMARMDAVARRTMSWSTTSTISHGLLHIDPCSRQMRVGERVVEVTRKEFDGDSVWIVTVRGMGCRLGERAAS